MFKRLYKTYEQNGLKINTDKPEHLAANSDTQITILFNDEFGGSATNLFAQATDNFPFVIIVQLVEYVIDT